MASRVPTIIAIILARGGSKSIPRKNIEEFLGKPLVSWTIETAQIAGIFDRIILSTDDKEIANLGRSLHVEVPFLRPPRLARDDTPTAPVVEHAIKWLPQNEGWIPDFIFVLEPTSPTRRPFHIREAVALLQESGADTVASVSLVPHHYIPSKVLEIGSSGEIIGVNGTHPRNMIHRRQDLPRYYALNGLIYACKAEWILKNSPTLWGDKVLGYIVDPKYAIDLDRPEDWAPAEARLKQILQEEEIR